MTHVPLLCQQHPQEKVTGYVFHIKELTVQGVEAWRRNLGRREKIHAEKSFFKCFRKELKVEMLIYNQPFHFAPSIEFSCFEAQVVCLC